MSQAPDNKIAYYKVLKFARAHYENFPVISFLIPRELRKHVAIIYWFARTADDFADEGNVTDKVRLENLDNFEKRLASLLDEKFNDEFDYALAQTIKSKKLSPEHFYNLLKAFKQDIVKKRYANFSEVLDYCKNSANSVGRLMLELFGVKNNEAFQLSDNICTALQLTNFYQDVAVDYKKGRIYFPEDEMKKFYVKENMFGINENSSNLKELVKFNVDRTRQLFEKGQGLFSFLRGKLKIEIKWTVFGGEAILDKIEKNDYDVLSNRPKLNKTDFIGLFLKSII